MNPKSTERVKRLYENTTVDLVRRPSCNREEGNNRDRLKCLLSHFNNNTSKSHQLQEILTKTKYLPRNTVYWVCSFSVVQHQPGSDRRLLFKSPKKCFALLCIRAWFRANRVERFDWTKHLWTGVVRIQDKHMFTSQADGCSSRSWGIFANTPPLKFAVFLDLMVYIMPQHMWVFPLCVGLINLICWLSVCLDLFEPWLTMTPTMKPVP